MTDRRIFEMLEDFKKIPKKVAKDYGFIPWILVTVLWWIILFIVIMILMFIFPLAFAWDRYKKAKSEREEEEMKKRFDEH